MTMSTSLSSITSTASRSISALSIRQSYSFVHILFLFNLLPLISTVDVFCGRLTVYDQQRFGLGSYAISSQVTTDLKQCLELCCGILNCDGVTFTGIFEARADEEPNCLLVGCRHSGTPSPETLCSLTDRVNDAEGLISVTLSRNQSTTTISPISVVQVQHNDLEAVTNPPSSVQPAATSTSVEETPNPSESSDYSTIRPPYSDPHSLAPVWAVGLAIVIAVVCVGLNLSLLSAYICYRRKQSRKQTAQISTIKGPTLHAYNPTI